MKKDDVKYTVCTEGSDYNFPYLRVMLLSLLKHSPWLKDNITVMTCELTPLSKHNKEILKDICQNIQFYEIDSSKLSSLNIKNSDKNGVLLSLYRLFSFDLTDLDLVIYMSSFNLCISDIPPLFKGASDIILSNSIVQTKNANKKNQYSNKDNPHTSVMMLSKEALNKNIFEKSLDTLNKKRNLNRITIDSIILESLRFKKASIDYWNNNQVIKKSRYNDSKFKSFLAIKKSVCIINMDIELNQRSKTQSHFMFKKINSIWTSYNKQGDWYTESINQSMLNEHVNSHLKRLKNRGINKKSRVELRTDSSINNTEYDSDFCIMITTYNRKKCVEKLTRNLKKMGNCKIVVIDDASNQDIDTRNIDDYTKLNTNNGKKGWWKTVNLLWGKAALYNCKYYIMLPDDALPNEDMFNEAIRLWESIKDPSKIAMHLANNNREKNWTNYSRTNYNSEIFKTQTTEFSFICKKEFIRYIIPPIHPYRWRKNKLLGSGVGDSLNRYWVSKKKNIYGVKKSLISKNKDCPHSLMNPEARKKNPWIIK